MCVKMGFLPGCCYRKITALKLDMSRTARGRLTPLSLSAVCDFAADVLMFILFQCCVS